MGEGTKESPYTSEDVLRLIEENGGTAEGLDLSRKIFEAGIDLRGLDLSGIILERAVFSVSPLFGLDNLPPDIVELDKISKEDLLSSIKDVHLEGVCLERANLKEANLHGAHLEGADLIDAHLERADLVGAHLERADLIFAHLESADMECTYLEGANLYSAHLEGAYLTETQFSRDTNFTSVHWGNYILGEEEERQFDVATDTYRRLKIWYTEHGIYDVAGEFFYREMEAKRKAQSWKKEPASKLWSWVMRLLCGYGERYANVVIAALVIIFGLAVVYVYGGLNLAYAIYFSAVSFTALGSASWVNITPEGWVRALGAVESFLGVFMMALFLVTFIRKMTR